MAKIEINNEIILLRHTVRQARVCVVNKLIKEAKLLRNKHGNEVQQEKYKRKADKLIAEVYALKRIKDDEISKFGITNERDLTAILQDESSSHYDRVKARVAYYKILYKRLMQFKEKFPDCKKYLVEGKKKNVKLKNKSVTKKSLKENPQPQNESSEEQEINSCKNIEHSQHKSKNEKMCNTELLETTNNLHECKKSSNEDSAPLKEEKVSRLEDDTLEDTVIHKQSSVIKSCNVTKEATVKRFTELLEEQESNKNVEMSIKVPDSTTQQAKISDDFFITGDNQDSQTSSVSASTSYVRSHKYNTRTFQSSNRVEKQNINYKNNTNLNKRYQDKQSNKSVKRLNNKTSIKINKDINKNNSNNVNNKEDSDLHPSWLAKRKEQKIMSQKFQGKKIVFADD
ncbi:Serum response factor-binding protein 1 [Camponotus floridanus]|uniref:Serum response factor-binding protein 1 n=1 Tax=Camponotus floridanus TaxID=104421 RepID=E2AE85_CAMFO|nr:serum response factor-binding protein 1 [Camponotus floridanus]EFN68318.1 Serum response factor-binding protein 1 [Camponotus floridanus]